MGIEYRYYLNGIFVLGNDLNFVMCSQNGNKYVRIIGIMYIYWSGSFMDQHS